MNDDGYLIKLKGAGVSNKAISEKLSIPVEEVEQRWQVILKTFSALEENGHGNLIQVFQQLAHQTQLVGESLKVIGGALGNSVSVAAIDKILNRWPEEMQAEQLMKEFIILQRFVPPISPVEDKKNN